MSQQAQQQPEQQDPKFHPWFHKFLVNFAFWAFAAFAILYGAKYIYRGIENGYHGTELVLLIIVNALLILLGLFLIKVRFDLAGFQPIAVREILWVCIAAAVLCLGNYWVKEIAGDDNSVRMIGTAGILACWGYVLHKYYKDRPYLFHQ